MTAPPPINLYVCYHTSVTVISSLLSLWSFQPVSILPYSHTKILPNLNKAQCKYLLPREAFFDLFLLNIHMRVCTYVCVNSKTWKEHGLQ